MVATFVATYMRHDTTWERKREMEKGKKEKEKGGRLTKSQVDVKKRNQTI